jgi:deoxyribodipyrimidine photo-lyase
VFTRHWVPELADVPAACLQMPWRMDLQQQRDAGCVIGKDYPRRIIDPAAAAAAARARLTEIRRMPGYRADSIQVFQRHGSRKRRLDDDRDPMPPPRRAPAQSRLDL